ncbi:unnamed protein product, partial [Ectocarpus sp. 12 AP-2014]
SVNIGKIPAKIARLSPDREALIDPHTERRISYGDLDARVRRLANGLRQNLGLAKGDRVAILSKNCIEYMEMIFACARCGLIAQPLNWRLSSEELARIIQDGEPLVIASSAEYADVAAALAVECGVATHLSFNHGGASSYEDLLASSADDEPDPDDQVGGDDPTLILYTGGTTGQSKGALHTHHSLYMGMLNQTVAERIVPTDVYMLTGQMFHIPVALAMNYMAHGCPL